MHFDCKSNHLISMLRLLMMSLQQVARYDIYAIYCLMLALKKLIFTLYAEHQSHHKQKNEILLASW